MGGICVDLNFPEYNKHIISIFFNHVFRFTQFVVKTKFKKSITVQYTMKHVCMFK